MTDITRRGAREYNAEDRAKVIDAFRRLAAKGAAIHVDVLAQMTGLGGRTVRSIMTEVDGIEFLLGGGDDGYSEAKSAEDAEALTRRLRATAFSLMDRVHRREHAQRALRRRQPGLPFDEEAA